jgi:hypothetical protein
MLYLKYSVIITEGFIKLIFKLLNSNLQQAYEKLTYTTIKYGRQAMESGGETVLLLMF